MVMPKRFREEEQAEGERFVARILKEPKLFLIGTANDLEKLAKIGQLKSHH